jgi:hypothetical protein
MEQLRLRNVLAREPLVAISIVVPWPATNRPHAVAIAIQSADAAVLVAADTTSSACLQ